MMKRIFSVLLAACLLFFCGAAMAAGADFERNRVEADGYGLPPAYAASEAQARLLARRAAVADAQRRLAEEISGVQIDAETTVQNMQLASDTVKTRVSALIRGASIVSESYADGAYRVVMALPLYGTGASLASAVLPPQTSAREPFPAYAAPAPPPAGQTGDAFTGLVVDCTGLDLRPAMSPVIKTDAGEPIYGYKNLDPETVIRSGMAGYSKSADGGLSRAGTNPLTVRAVGVDHYFNPVVSAADARRILAENSAAHFLDRCAVVFVR